MPVHDVDLRLQKTSCQSECIFHPADAKTELLQGCRVRRQPAVVRQSIGQIECDNGSGASALDFESQCAARGAEIENPLSRKVVSAEIFVVPPSEIPQTDLSTNLREIDRVIETTRLELREMLRRRNEDVAFS